ncbi:hypothetical protein E0384_24220 [Escherichia coli]|nr:hypothetical protein [Escherichia coli]
MTRLSTSSPASGTCPAIALVQQNKSTIVRLRSFVCAASGSPEKCVNMSSPDAYRILAASCVVNSACTGTT